MGTQRAARTRAIRVTDFRLLDEISPLFSWLCVYLVFIPHSLTPGVSVRCMVGAFLERVPFLDPRLVTKTLFPNLEEGGGKIRCLAFIYSPCPIVMRWQFQIDAFSYLHTL